MTYAPVVVGPVFDHLKRLTDSRGLFEHALFAEPRPEHGYCLDDAARALVVTCREPSPSAAVEALARGYLAFTLSAVRGDGSCHNRMSADGTWSDEGSLGDWWGRAVWGLGVAGAHAPTATMRMAAADGFRRAAVRRSPHLRAMAFAALGAGEMLAVRRDDDCARDLLRDAVSAIGKPSEDPTWRWPEARLAYANGSVVEALLIAGTALPDPETVGHGLAMLDFLLGLETCDGHLSVTPVGGRGPDDATAAFDQQPIEVAAIADACARAFALTGDSRWLTGVHSAWAWFLGDNDSATVMFDPLTGGGYDGLERDGRNDNQGAESTLAALSTAQHALALGLM